MDLKAYFEILGWQETDYLFVARHADKWRECLFALPEVSGSSESTLNDGADWYYTGAYFGNWLKRRSKGTVHSMRELILDVDFKMIDTDRKNAEAKARAMTDDLLPVPTVLVHSGNGYHLHYRLYEPDKWLPFRGRGAAYLREKYKADGGWSSQIVDKAQYESVYRRLIEWVNSQYPDYLDACWSCEHVFRLPFSFNCKDKDDVKPVQILEWHDVGYTLDDFEALIPDLFNQIPDTTKSVKAQRHAISGVCRRVKTCGYDRSKAVYSVVMKVMELFPAVEERTLLSVLKKDYPELTERYPDDNALRADVRRIVCKADRGGITAVLPIEQMRLDKGYDLSYLEDQRRLFDKAVFSTRGNNDDKFDAMLQVYDRLWADGASGIISVPCSSSKTFSALIYAAWLSSAQLAKWSKKIWVVSEKISDCQRNADVLTKLGARAVAYHSRPADCTEKGKDFWKRNKPCENCANPCGAKIKYLHNLDWALNRNDIICVTHKFLSSELAKNAKIKADLVIIDESPTLFEQFELTENDITMICEHLDGADRLADLFYADVQSKIKSVLVDQGTHKIEKLDLENYADAVKVAWIHAQQGRSGGLDRLEAVLGFFRFFQSSENIYGTKTGLGAYRFIAGQVEVDIPESVVWVLDGSAKNQLTKWQGFKIYEVPELQVNFPNMHIKLLPGNSTKSNLGKSATRNRLVSAAAEITGGTAMLFANKTKDNTDAMDTVVAVRKVLASNGCTVIDMDGSNRGRSAKSNLVCMSLFSDVADYALKASLYHNKEFLESDIFGKQKTNGVEWKFVKLNNGGFECKEIRDVATRQMQRDLYQCIMRGIVRDNPNADYDVVAIVSDPAIIHGLRDDLPGASIAADGMEIIELWFEGKSSAEIEQALSISQQAVSKAVQAFRERLGF